MWNSSIMWNPSTHAASVWNSPVQSQDDEPPMTMPELSPPPVDDQQQPPMMTLSDRSPPMPMLTPPPPMMSAPPAWNPALISTMQQQQAALVMHLISSGYAAHYAQMAATAAILNQLGDPFNRIYRYNPHQSSSRSSYTWTGELPPRNYENPVFSCKIFVGGVPWDITEAALLNAFKPYGACRVEWPGKEARYTRSVIRPVPRGKVTGYVYIIFDQEKSVRALLGDCSQEFGSGGEWYFKLTARRIRTKEIRQVQVIPWVISDATHLQSSTGRLDPKKTVFVGALHGMITAPVLFSIMDELFGNVLFVAIDTDKYKYPIGSGRVTFSSNQSYFRAIESAFVEVKTSKFTKKVQIDPFLEDASCSICENNPGPYFCREKCCFRYFCRPCWQNCHAAIDGYRQHKPLMRNTRRSIQLTTDSESGGEAPSGYDQAAVGAESTSPASSAGAGGQDESPTSSGSPPGWLQQIYSSYTM